MPDWAAINAKAAATRAQRKAQGLGPKNPARAAALRAARAAARAARQGTPYTPPPPPRATSYAPPPRASAPPKPKPKVVMSVAPKPDAKVLLLKALATFEDAMVATFSTVAVTPEDQKHYERYQSCKARYLASNAKTVEEKNEAANAFRLAMAQMASIVVR